jgi:hypothetical protein
MKKKILVEDIERMVREEVSKRLSEERRLPDQAFTKNGTTREAEEAKLREVYEAMMAAGVRVSALDLDTMKFTIFSLGGEIMEPGEGSLGLMQGNQIVSKIDFGYIPG